MAMYGNSLFMEEEENFGKTTGQSRRQMMQRMFDRWGKQPIAVSPASTYAPSQATEYADGGDFSDAGYGAWSDAGANYGTTVDPTTGRVKDAFYSGLGELGIAGAGMYGLGQAVGSYAGAPSNIVGDISTGLATKAVTSGLPGFAGKLATAATGVENDSTVGKIAEYGISGLGKLVGGPLGIAASIAAPFGGDAISDALGTRYNEKLRDAFEDADGYFGGRQSYRNINDSLANSYAARVSRASDDAYSAYTRSVEAIQNNPADVNLQNEARLAYDMHQTLQDIGLTPTYDDEERISDNVHLSALTNAHPGFTQEDAETVRADIAGTQPNAGFGYSINPNSVNYAGNFNAMGYDTSHLSDQDRMAAVRDFNMAQSNSLNGPHGTRLNQLRTDSVMGSYGLGYSGINPTSGFNRAADFNANSYYSGLGSALSSMMSHYGGGGVTGGPTPGTDGEGGLFGHDGRSSESGSRGYGGSGTGSGHSSGGGVTGANNSAGDAGGGGRGSASTGMA